MSDPAPKITYKLPKQMLEPNVLYSITLNPENSSQFLGKKDRYKKFHTRIYNLLVDLPIEYDLVIELSEPIKKMYLQGFAGPRLHLHGVIQFPNRKSLQQFLLTGYYKITRISSIDIDTIDDLNYWTQYCNKQHILPVSRRIYNKPLMYIEEK